MRPVYQCPIEASCQCAVIRAQLQHESEAAIAEEFGLADRASVYRHSHVWQLLSSLYLKNKISLRTAMTDTVWCGPGVFRLAVPHAIREPPQVKGELTVNTHMALGRYDLSAFLSLVSISCAKPENRIETFVAARRSNR